MGKLLSTRILTLSSPQRGFSELVQGILIHRGKLTRYKDHHSITLIIFSDLCILHSPCAFHTCAPYSVDLDMTLYKKVFLFSIVVEKQPEKHQLEKRSKIKPHRRDDFHFLRPLSLILSPSIFWSGNEKTFYCLRDDILNPRQAITTGTLCERPFTRRPY